MIHRIKNINIQFNPELKVDCVYRFYSKHNNWRGNCYKHTTQTGNCAEKFLKQMGL